MKRKDISVKNKEAILNSIISANAGLLIQLKTEHNYLSAFEINVVLLWKLDFSFDEIRIILGSDIKRIEEILENYNHKNY
jgi:hypothetical protein